jgi:hypothetical protein
MDSVTVPVFHEFIQNSLADRWPEPVKEGTMVFVVSRKESEIAKSAYT